MSCTKPVNPPSLNIIENNTLGSSSLESDYAASCRARLSVDHSETDIMINSSCYALGVYHDVGLAVINS